MVGELHHVGLAVPSIEGALPFFTEVLGKLAGAVRVIPGEPVRAAFLAAGASLLELIEPTDDSSGLARFVAERGRPTLHHVCYAVGDLPQALRELEAAGAELIDRAPRAGLAGDVAFLHPRASGGLLIELVDAATAISATHTGPR